MTEEQFNAHLIAKTRSLGAVVELTTTLPLKTNLLCRWTFGVDMEGMPFESFCSN